MAASTKSAPVTAMDPVWDAIRANAREMLTSEPSLSSLVMANVLNHESFEAALAHRLPDAVAAAYLRSDFFDKRLNLMEDWAAYCLSGPQATPAP